jgi:hypothetical protein
VLYTNTRMYACKKISADLGGALLRARGRTSGVERAHPHYPACPVVGKLGHFPHFFAISAHIVGHFPHIL